MARKEKNNNNKLDSTKNARSITTKDDREKDDSYTDENFDVTDSDAAESDPRIKHASRVSHNTIEEGDEDYDDEQEKLQE